VLLVCAYMRSDLFVHSPLGLFSDHIGLPRRHMVPVGASCGTIQRSRYVLSLERPRRTYVGRIVPRVYTTVHTRRVLGELLLSCQLKLVIYQFNCYHCYHCNSGSRSRYLVCRFICISVRLAHESSSRYAYGSHIRKAL
jgi:hypothetical protein